MTRQKAEGWLMICRIAVFAGIVMFVAWVN